MQRGAKDHIGPQPRLQTKWVSFCSLGVVAGWMWAFPALRKVDQFEEAAEASGTRPPAHA